MVANDSVVDVLLLEDNPNDAELAIRALKKNNLANHLEWVKYGAAALDFLFQRGDYADRPDCSPKMDGIEVLGLRRANPQTRELPVVILTSSKEERDLVATYRLGANRFVAKPVAFDAFAKTVADLGMYWVLVNRLPPEIRST
ncbi:response regulator [Thiorhodococcus fuscus]|uniref:Response regulator n=1 Tax=Thiorhodococcus fuscus TaxID=527200 RepID=A0ABW4YDG5_9GAMM